jgi:hypothetical protein
MNSFKLQPCRRVNSLFGGAGSSDHQSEKKQQPTASTAAPNGLRDPEDIQDEEDIQVALVSRNASKIEEEDALNKLLLC